MDAIFQNIWEMSLFAIPVILVFALLSNKLGKRYGAKWRYLLWMVIAIRLCIPVQIDLPVCGNDGCRFTGSAVTFAGNVFLHRTGV
ncbi:MAG: hypothetical protein IJ969_05190 [Anaerotignum sp.]|nr:hypothetical protein [Anaerotignum sp.]